MDALDFGRAESMRTAEMPEVPGCYILVAERRAMNEMGLECPSEHAALYVGKAKNSILRRVAGSHLRAARSGSSTFRRSVGALLRERLALLPRPRSDNPRDGKRFVNYKFDSASEKAVSNWIDQNIRIVSVQHENPRSFEVRCIRELCPPLNLMDWPNPYRAMVTSARKQCALLAEACH